MRCFRHFVRNFNAHSRFANTPLLHVTALSPFKAPRFSAFPSPFATASLHFNAFPASPSPSLSNCRVLQHHQRSFNARKLYRLHTPSFYIFGRQKVLFPSLITHVSTRFPQLVNLITRLFCVPTKENKKPLYPRHLITFNLPPEKKAQRPGITAKRRVP